MTGRQAGRQRGRKGGRKSPGKKSLPPFGYLILVCSSLRTHRHCTDCSVYSPAVWDNLETLWGQSPHLCPLCLFHCLTQGFELTWPLVLVPLFFSSSDLSQGGQMTLAKPPWDLLLCQWKWRLGCHSLELLDSLIVESIYTTRLSSANKLLGCWFTSSV